MLCWIESCRDACVSVKSFNIVLNYPHWKNMNIYFLSLWPTSTARLHCVMSPHNALCILYKLLPDWKGHIYLVFWLFQLRVLFLEVPWSLSCSVDWYSTWLGKCLCVSPVVLQQLCICAHSTPYFFLSLI